MTDNNFSINSLISGSDLSVADRNDFGRKYSDIKECNILIVGGTGVGKSSTINAILQKRVASVGVGVEPETRTVRKYSAGKLNIWDTPGLGDGNVSDEVSRSAIREMLRKTRSDGRSLIDVVLVVLESDSRDMGTVFELIRNVILPELDNDSSRILIGANQADMVKDGKLWDKCQNKPSELLDIYYEQFAETIRNRIYDSLGIRTEPIVYAAGYTNPDSLEQEKSYNISKLVYKAICIADNNHGCRYSAIVDDYEGAYCIDPLETISSIIDTVIFEPVDSLLGGIINFLDGLF